MRVLLAALAILIAPAPVSAQQPQLPNCEAAEHRALDFWIGEWDAYRADTNALSGHSTITSIQAGCVVREQWTSAGTAHSGESYNIYDRVSGRWEQYWVSSTGNRTHYVGGPIENGMQLTTPVPSATSASGTAVFWRVTLTAQPDGTVHQRGQNSTDGTNWTTNYLLIYRRRVQ
jgi:hypothetical protein